MGRTPIPMTKIVEVDLSPDLEEALEVQATDVGVLLSAFESFDQRTRFESQPPKVMYYDPATTSASRSYVQVFTVPVGGGNSSLSVANEIGLQTTLPLQTKRSFRLGDR